MPIIELTTSRRITYGSGAPVGVREYHLSGYATESSVLALFDGVNLPAKLQPWPSSGFFTPAVDLRVFDFELERDPQVLECWRVRITYREQGLDAVTPNLAPNDAGYITMRASFESVFEDAWRNWDTVEDLNAAAALVLDSNRNPLYDPGTVRSDIGGRRIDVAGYPTSIQNYKQRVTLDVTSQYRPNPSVVRGYLGTRNSTAFLGFEVASAVFTGAEGSVVSPGKWQITYNFEVDYYYHLKQVPARHPNGDVKLDVAGAESGEDGGQAKIVSWVQPYPRLTEFRNINNYLIFI